MTRKDYVKLADMLYMLRKHNPYTNKGYGEEYTEALRDVEDRLIGILASDNSRFDVGKFRESANPVIGRVKEHA